jgi:hypothetical protein
MNGRQPFEYLVDSEFEGAFLVLGAAEGAELAPVHTDIGRIYVAVDDEIGFLTVLSFGGFRCHPPDPKDIIVLKQTDCFFIREPSASFDPVRNYL